MHTEDSLLLNMLTLEFLCDWKGKKKLLSILPLSWLIPCCDSCSMEICVKVKVIFMIQFSKMLLQRILSDLPQTITVQNFDILNRWLLISSIYQKNLKESKVPKEILLIDHFNQYLLLSIINWNFENWLIAKLWKYVSYLPPSVGKKVVVTVCTATDSQPVYACRLKLISSGF